MTTKLEQAARQLLEAVKSLPPRKGLLHAAFALEEELHRKDHSADAGNKVSDHIAASGKPIDHIHDATKMVCNWHQDDDDGTWATDCGGVFVIIEGAPSDNEMKFCVYCGKPIKEHLFVDSEDGQ